LFSKVPYPKAGFSTYISIVLTIALVVVFILMVFEPFGTSSFVHPNKKLILAGYGMTIIVVVLLYYLFIEAIVPNTVKDKWTIIHEVSYLFLNVVLCLIGCYVYYSLVFSYSIRFSGFIDFLFYSGTVAVIPVVFYLIFIYFHYRGVSYLNTKTETVPSSLMGTTRKLTLSGISKKEEIQVVEDDLLYIKSNDNYVILYLQEHGTIKRKMLRNSLNRIEGMVGDALIRCHRSYLVNPSKICSIDGNITNTKLSIQGSETQIPVSRTKVEMFRSMM